MNREKKILREKELNRIRKMLSPSSGPRFELIEERDRISGIEVISGDLRVRISFGQYSNKNLAIGVRLPTGKGFLAHLPTTNKTAMIRAISPTASELDHCSTCGKLLPDRDYVRAYSPNNIPMRECQGCRDIR